VTALEVALSDGQTTRCVARLHGERDLAAKRNVARDEFRLLEILRAYGIAAPKPIFVDESCDLFPTPIVVIEFVDGVTIDDAGGVDDADHLVRTMAEQLALIHRVPESPNLAFLPRADRPFPERPATLNDALSEGRIRDALEAFGSPAQVNRSVLLHGDYWPGNILWNGADIAAVIDWEDAEVGDPLSDLGNSRLEILWMFGDDAMRTFTNYYLALTDLDTSNLPYWDLRAALRPCATMSGWGLDGDDEARMQDLHGSFIELACAGLRGRLGDAHD
jgi:aminoglycoside phosphotransferase (APT) family kinase protein